MSMALVSQKMVQLIFLTLLLVLRFDIGETKFYIIPPTIKVAIFNYLVQPPSNLNLTLHCKSKDNDLGFHTLAIGNSFEFHFHKIPFGTTLFFCSFTWPEQNSSLHYVDIYNANRDDCIFCFWKIGKQGACLFEKE